MRCREGLTHVSTEDNTNTSAQVHTTRIPVRWSDFDRFNHLNNVSYIEVAQEARTAFAQDEFAARGLPIPAVFVRRTEVDYFRPILPDTTAVEIDTTVVQIGRTSFTTHQSIKDRNGTVCCTVDCVQIAVDLATSSPRAITKHELGVLTQVADSAVVNEATSADDSAETSADD